jgi:hypothetical protein
MKKLTCIVFAALLAGCASVGAPPLMNQIEAASLAAMDAALQIDRLEKAKLISNETEDQLMDQLLEVNKALRTASALAAGCKPDCSNAEAQLRLANTLLIKLQSEVPK